MNLMIFLSFNYIYSLVTSLDNHLELVDLTTSPFPMFIRFRLNNLIQHHIHFICMKITQRCVPTANSQLLKGSLNPRLIDNTKDVYSIFIRQIRYRLDGQYKTKQLSCIYGHILMTNLYQQANYLVESQHHIIIFPTIGMFYTTKNFLDSIGSELKFRSYPLMFNHFRFS